MEVTILPQIKLDIDNKPSKPAHKYLLILKYADFDVQQTDINKKKKFKNKNIQIII